MLENHTLVPTVPLHRRRQTRAFATFDSALRAAASLADLDGESADLAAVWHSLVHEHQVVLDHFHTPERWFIVLGGASIASTPPPRRARAHLLLGMLFLGHRQKAMALDAGISPSTVSGKLNQALQGMGVALQPRRAPAVLAVLAHAGAGCPVPPSRASAFTYSSRACHVVSVERPELRLARSLPRAEYAVLCAITEGRPYADIAADRSTSTRTVANQVASLFHRLGVSGRNELIVHLLTGQSA